MALVGADIEQLRQLSRAFNLAAERLEATAGEVTGRLASAPWQGPDADRYRSQWNGESLLLIRSVIGALRAAATVVDKNAAEQEQASAGAGAGQLSGGMVPAGPGGHIPTQGSSPLVDIRNFLNSNAAWPVTWGTLLDQATPLGPILPLLDALGLADDSSLSPQDKIIEATNALTDLGGGVLKGRGGPVGYLGGVAVAQWGDVAANVARADFSASTLQATVDYISTDPGGAFVAAKDAVVAYVPKLFSNLLR